MADSNTDLSLAELLDKADVTKKDYIDASVSLMNVSLTTTIPQ